MTQIPSLSGEGPWSRGRPVRRATHWSHFPRQNAALPPSIMITKGHRPPVQIRRGDIGARSEPGGPDRPQAADADGRSGVRCSLPSPSSPPAARTGMGFLTPISILGRFGDQREAQGADRLQLGRRRVMAPQDRLARLRMRPQPARKLGGKIGYGELLDQEQTWFGVSASRAKMNETRAIERRAGKVDPDHPERHRRARTHRDAQRATFRGEYQATAAVTTTCH